MVPAAAAAAAGAAAVGYRAADQRQWAIVKTRACTCVCVSQAGASDPTCARISFSGSYEDLSAEGKTAEASFAYRALLSKHPQMEEWGKPGAGSHGFHLFKLNIDTIFFLDNYVQYAPKNTALRYAAAAGLTMLCSAVCCVLACAQGGASPLTAEEYFAAQPPPQHSTE